MLIVDCGCIECDHGSDIYMHKIRQLHMVLFKVCYADMVHGHVKSFTNHRRGIELVGDIGLDMITVKFHCRPFVPWAYVP